MMKQAQEIQKKMEKLRGELDQKIYEASSGGDMVKATMDGKMQLQSISISKDVVDPDDVELLEGLVLTAIKEVVKKVQEDQNEHFSGLTGGVKIPGLF